MQEIEKPAAMYTGNIDDDRLAYMAQLGLNRITLDNLGASTLGQESTVLDVGAGPSPELGISIRNLGARYIAVDQNEHAMEQQRTAGNAAITGSVTDLPLRTGSATHVNARFCLSWLNDEGRRRAWGELLRAGAQNCDVVETEYDWSTAKGTQEFDELIGKMKSHLASFGFEADYGSRVEADVSEILNDYSVAHTTTSSRQPIPAHSVEEKKAVVKKTAESILGALGVAGEVQKAQELSESLDEFLRSDVGTEEFTLADVVTVVSRLQGTSGARLDQKRPGSDEAIEDGAVTVALNVESELSQPVRVWRLHPGWDMHPLGLKGKDLFYRIYARSGYIINDGMVPDEFEEAIDPASLRARSNMFLALNPLDEPECSVRLIHADDDGLRSLPVTKKLIEAYGEDSIPEDLDRRDIAEIGYFAGNSADPLVMMRCIIAAVHTARQQGVRHIYYGAVSGGVSRHFKRTFGHSLTQLNIDGKEAQVTVTGRGYHPEGIPLKLGYIEVCAFMPRLIEYYRKLNNNYTPYVTDLCSQLQD